MIYTCCGQHPRKNFLLVDAVEKDLHLLKSVTNTLGKVNDREQQINKHLLSVMVLLEKGLATHSSILAWRIPWTEEPCGLQSMGSHRVGQD